MSLQPRTLWTPRNPEDRFLGLALPVVLASLVLAVPAHPLPAQEVHLPLERYETLRQKAEPVPEIPVPVALEQAHLALTVDQDRARLTQEMDVILLADGWRRVPLPAVGRYLATELGAVEGFLSQSSEGTSQPVLHLRGQGRHRLRLEAVLPVAEDANAAEPTRRVRLELPAAAVVRGTLTAPGVTEVTVHGGLAEKTDRGWTWFGPPGGRVVIELREADEATTPPPSEQPLRFETVAATAVEAGRTRTGVDLWLEHRVLSGRMTETTVDLPPNLELLSVDADPPADWDTEDGTLTVRPVQAVEGTLSLHLRFNGPPAGPAFTLPTVAVPGTLRQRTWARLQVSGAGLARLQPAAAVEEVEIVPPELPAAFRQAGGPLLRLEDPARPPAWELLWSEGVDVLAVDVPRLRADLVVGEDGRAVLQLWIEVRSRGGRQLRLTPPAGYRPLRATRNGQPWTPAVDAGDLLWPLPATGATTVLSITGVLPLAVPDNGPFSVPLPAFSAPVRQVEMRLLLPGGRRYQLEDPSRQGLVDVPPAPPTLATGDALGRLLGAPATGVTGRPEAPYPGPDGFQEIHATWSALTERPTPLRLEVDSQTSRPDWF